MTRADSLEESRTLDYLTPYFETTPFETPKRIEIQRPNEIQKDVIPIVRKAYDLVGEGVIDDFYWNKIGELMEEGLERYRKREGKKRVE